MAERPKLTFFVREITQCPICGTKFQREDLHSGGGRIVSGPLSDELHRTFLPSSRYGSVYPLIYSLTVCPDCWYSAMEFDFSNIKDDTIAKIRADQDNRKQQVQDLLDSLDFKELRNLRSGLASYLLASFCYDLQPDKSSPMIRQAICTLRASWLCEDLHKEEPRENYRFLMAHLKRKTAFFYRRALEMEEKHMQIIPSDIQLGPDVEKNYGYDGFIYLVGLLEYRYGSRDLLKKRLERLQYVKRIIAKSFGFGKASKARPSDLLDNARSLHDILVSAIQELEVSVGS